jgi:hypothetical protein
VLKGAKKIESWYQNQELELDQIIEISTKLVQEVSEAYKNSNINMKSEISQVCFVPVHKISQKYFGPLAQFSQVRITK